MSWPGSTQDLSRKDITVKSKIYSIKTLVKPEVIKDGVVKVNMSSIGIRNGFLMQADCRDQGLLP